MLKTKQFYLLLLGLFFVLPAYFILNPVFLSLGADGGLTTELAVIGVALTGISNAAGRLVLAWISDKIGRKAGMILLSVFVLVGSLVMIIAEGPLFIICIMLISFGFGGAAGVYSAMTAESFGAKNVGMNWGLVMIGFAGSALLFPIISKQLTAGGSYTSSFIMAAVTCVIAIVMVLMMKTPERSVVKK
jgi:OFA family oxalate/formate antiporter-like MFS transporter